MAQRGENTKSLPGIVQNNALMETAAAKHSEITENGVMLQKAGETVEKQDKNTDPKQQAR